jgi:hypothetical protein
MNAFHYFLIFAKVDLGVFFWQIIFLVKMRSLSSLVNLIHLIYSSSGGGGDRFMLLCSCSLIGVVVSLAPALVISLLLSSSRVSAVGFVAFRTPVTLEYGQLRNPSGS